MTCTVISCLPCTIPCVGTTKRAARLNRLVADAEKELSAQGGRLLLRYSGTEPKARLLVEGRDAKVLDKWSRQICGAIQKQIGV